MNDLKSGVEDVINPHLHQSGLHGVRHGCVGPPLVGDRPPEDLVQFLSWNGVAPDYESAVELARKRKLKLGEPCVIEFLYEGRTELLFAIGTRDASRPYTHTSVMQGNIDNATLTDAVTGEDTPIREYISVNGGLAWESMKEQLK